MRALLASNPLFGFTTDTIQFLHRALAELYMVDPDPVGKMADFEFPVARIEHHGCSCRVLATCRRCLRHDTGPLEVVSHRLGILTVVAIIWRRAVTNKSPLCDLSTQRGVGGTLSVRPPNGVRPGYGLAKTWNCHPAKALHPDACAHDPRCYDMLTLVPRDRHCSAQRGAAAFAVLS